jgi:hypothetical protein
MLLRNPPRIALVLLASLAGLLIAGAVARGEPAATAPPSSADANCLAKPNAQAAAGNHWYYRLDRASGRHCWYQRPTIAGTNAAAQSRPSTRAIAAPVDKPVPESPADRPSAARDQPLDQNAVEPAAAAPAQPYSWSTAAPPPAPSEQTTPAPTDIATPTPVIATAEPAVAPQTDAAAAPPRIAPVTTARLPVAERPDAVAADGGHMPALFGTAFALVIIVLGSVVARFGAKLARARRRGVARNPASLSTPVPAFLRAQDTPGLVPSMAREDDIPPEDDITHAAPPAWMTRRAPAAPREDAPSGDEAALSNRDSARELEQNVRDLLHRMRSDLKAVRTAQVPQRPQPRSAPERSQPRSAPERSQPRSAEELDQVLAMWRQGRRRPAG